MTCSTPKGGFRSELESQTPIPSTVASLQKNAAHGIASGNATRKVALMRGRVALDPTATFPLSDREQCAFDELRFIRLIGPTFKRASRNDLTGRLMWPTIIRDRRTVRGLFHQCLDKQRDTSDDFTSPTIRCRHCGRMRNLHDGV